MQALRPRMVTIDDKAGEHLVEFCRRQQYTKLLLVADRNTYAAQGKAVAEALIAAGCDLKQVVFRGEEVVADAAQLRQLVWNLVRNAVQASSPGDAVEVSIDADADGFVLAVSDRGQGIDDEARERLFDAFFTTRSHGTGVGLAVVKAIADEHGFSVEVDSQEGRGATFRVHLPSGLAAEAPGGGNSPDA